jgi:hypothetical protein
LTEYANSGGKLIAMGQDLAAVLGSDATGSNAFLYNIILGATWLQDSVTGYLTPTLPIVPVTEAPHEFNGISLDVGDPAASGGDGAGNQLYIDEVHGHPPKIDLGDPSIPEEIYPHYKALLQYPGTSNENDGIVGVTHRYQPTLENPGLAYLGRSVYTTFGLEGVNNGAGSTSREELLEAFMNWAKDEPVVTITDVTSDYSATAQMAVFEAELTSNVEHAEGEVYRWDWGDGSPFTPPSEAGHTGSVGGNTGGHDYELCGSYTIRAEVTDSWGNTAIGSQNFLVSQNCMGIVYMPVIRN